MKCDFKRKERKRIFENNRKRRIKIKILQNETGKKIKYEI